MDKYKNSIVSKMKLFCIAMCMLLSVQYFIVGALYAEELVWKENNQESVEYHDTLQMISQLGIPVKSGDSYQKQGVLSLSGLHTKRCNCRATLYRIFILFISCLMAVSCSRVVLLEKTSCFSRIIIQFLHLSDGKKR